MQMIDLQSREVFGDDGCGVATLLEEPGLKISQIGLEPGKKIPVHTTEAAVALQVVRGEGIFSVDGQRVQLGPGKMLRLPKGSALGVANGFAGRLVFLAIETPDPQTETKDVAAKGRSGSFVNLVDFAPLKPGKQEAFLDWFRRSSEVFAGHRGFVSRTLLGPIEGGSGYAAIVEHESKETFMDMHLSDDRVQLFRQMEPLVLGESKPRFYETLLSFHK
jgi:quercetin dioxygenase-like cupin family protein/heme-degrading monooxygenase HmoA